MLSLLSGVWPGGVIGALPHLPELGGGSDGVGSSWSSSALKLRKDFQDTDCSLSRSCHQVTEYMSEKGPLSYLSGVFTRLLVQGSRLIPSFFLFYPPPHQSPSPVSFAS